MNYFEQHNLLPSSIKATLKGGDFTNLPKNIYWFYNPVNNEVNFSPVDLGKNTIEKYVEYLNMLKPKFFHAYPSSMIFLINNMQESDLSFNFDIDTIFLISESFTDEDINQIADFFNCSVAATYGHTERLVFAESTGRTVSGYQVNRRYGYFELINENGRNIELDQIRGEIVGTGFDNYAMPVLRYKTDDFTSYKDFNKKTISLVESPRKQLYIDDKDGNKISDHALLRQAEMRELEIMKYQIVQTVPGKIKLLLLTKRSFNNNRYQELVSSLNTRVGDRLKIEIIVTDKLILTKSNKCIPLIKEY